MRSFEKMNPNETDCFFLHHTVLKENSVTTKLEVVFNSSCATDNDISLNDIFLVDPVEPKMN